MVTLLSIREIRVIRGLFPSYQRSSVVLFLRLFLTETDFRSAIIALRRRKSIPYS
jgi:hypothetical protein